MDLVSCERCGVVLDRDRYTFPETQGADGEWIYGTYEYDSDFEKRVAVVPCPVCEHNIKDRRRD